MRLSSWKHDRVDNLPREEAKQDQPNLQLKHNQLDDLVEFSTTSATEKKPMRTFILKSLFCVDNEYSIKDLN